LILVSSPIPGDPREAAVILNRQTLTVNTRSGIKEFKVGEQFRFDFDGTLHIPGEQNLEREQISSESWVRRVSDTAIKNLSDTWGRIYFFTVKGYIDERHYEELTAHAYNVTRSGQPAIPSLRLFNFYLSQAGITDLFEEIRQEIGAEASEMDCLNFLRARRDQIALEAMSEATFCGVDSTISAVRLSKKFRTNDGVGVVISTGSPGIILPKATQDLGISEYLHGYVFPEESHGNKNFGERKIDYNIYNEQRAKPYADPFRKAGKLLSRQGFDQNHSVSFEDTKNGAISALRALDETEGTVLLGFPLDSHEPEVRERSLFRLSTELSDYLREKAIPLHEGQRIVLMDGWNKLLIEH